jgi:L-asparaginase
MSIRIIITGGTFDKQYDEIHGELTFKDTHLPRILSKVRCTLPVEWEINQLTDSLQMREENRASILESCRAAPEERIIVTHGTDTMTDTAQVLSLAQLDQTIVLTGAMIPFAVKGSDAVFNLGCSFTAVQLLPHGVYIVMNGQVFPGDQVRKNRQKGVFEPLVSTV